MPSRALAAGAEDAAQSHSLQPDCAHQDGFNQYFVGIQVKALLLMNPVVVRPRTPGALITPVLNSMPLNPVIPLLHQIDRSGVRPGMDLEVYQCAEKPLIMHAPVLETDASPQASFDLQAKTPTLTHLLETQDPQAQAMQVSQFTQLAVGRVD